MVTKLMAGLFMTVDNFETCCNKHEIKVLKDEGQTITVIHYGKKANFKMTLDVVPDETIGRPRNLKRMDDLDADISDDANWETAHSSAISCPYVVRDFTAEFGGDKGEL